MSESGEGYYFYFLTSMKANDPHKLETGDRTDTTSHTHISEQSWNRAYGTKSEYS